MSSGKQPGGKNGPATAGHIANLERRLLTSENFCRSMAIGKQSGGKNGTAGHVANLECRLLTSENFCRSMAIGKQSRLTAISGSESNDLSCPCCGLVVALLVHAFLVTTMLSTTLRQ